MVTCSDPAYKLHEADLQCTLHIGASDSSDEVRRLSTAAPPGPDNNDAGTRSMWFITPAENVTAQLACSSLCRLLLTLWLACLQSALATRPTQYGVGARCLSRLGLLDGTAVDSALTSLASLVSWAGLPVCSSALGIACCAQYKRFQ